MAGLREEERANLSCAFQVGPGRAAGVAQVLLAEKRFEGCGGLELEDEMRVTISAVASLLILHRETNYFPKLETVLVYPSAYLAPSVEPLGGGAVLEGLEPRVGESWRSGVVIIAWDQMAGGASMRSGRNVVLHEFAHQLDYESGDADGAPSFDSAAEAREWSRVFSKEYDRLKRAVDRGASTLIDDYRREEPGRVLRRCHGDFLRTAAIAPFETSRALQAPRGILPPRPRLAATLGRTHPGPGSPRPVNLRRIEIEFAKKRS